MFQYTREIIINDQKFEQREKNGVIELFIPNVGSYKSTYVKKYVTNEPKLGECASINIPTSATATKAGDVIKYTVKLKMQTGEVDALLANYTTLFTRGIVVEVATGATQENITAAFKEAMRGMEEWPVRISPDGTKIEATTPYLSLCLVKEELKYRVNSISEMTVVASTEGSLVVGQKPFGTYEYLVKNHRLPTMENIRPWGEAQEEYPVKGATYHLFEVTYEADRNIGGFDVLGQKATSVTKHRFWVRSDKATAFSDILTALTATEGSPEASGD